MNGCRKLEQLVKMLAECVLAHEVAKDLCREGKEEL